MDRLRFDGLENWLGANLSPEDTSTIEFTRDMVFAGGVGTIPTLVKGQQYIPLSILDSEYRLSEIVWLTEFNPANPRMGTVSRGMEGTARLPHPSGRKIVQAATVLDFTLVQDHTKDPNAHPDLVAALKSYVDSAIAAHNADPNAHTYLARTESPVFTGTATFENIDLAGKLDALPGAWIEVSYDDLSSAKMTIDGALYIHGHRIVIGGTETVRGPNTVWIKTFGA